MKRSLGRVLTTHTGSLYRPPDLLEMLISRLHGEAVDEQAFHDRLRLAIDEVVAEQAACGVDVVNDGELSKPNFAEYITDRVNGFEGVNPEPIFPNRRLDFPEYFADQPRQPALASRAPLCVGPLSWKDKEAVEIDIANLRAAVAKVGVEEAFLPAPSPGIVAMRVPNTYYASDEEYLYALSDILSEEYRAIVDAGLLLQIDAPDAPFAWDMETGADDLGKYRRTVALRNDALNHALEGIPEESVRYHICWGNYEGPHTLDIGLHEIVDLVLAVNAQGYVIEAANPRHAHEWEVWQDVALPEGKVLIPGVIDSTTNFVEHPEHVAQRIIRFADVVGRENVIAGVDCGFGTFARLAPRVHPQVVWAKFKAMAEGAKIASQKLWK